MEQNRSGLRRQIITGVCSGIGGLALGCLLMLGDGRAHRYETETIRSGTVPAVYQVRQTDFQLGPEYSEGGNGIRPIYGSPEPDRRPEDARTEEEKLIDEFKRQADTNKDGKTSAEEMKRAIEEMGFQPPEIDDGYQIRIRLDPNGKGIEIKGCPQNQMIVIPESRVRDYICPVDLEE